MSVAASPSDVFLRLVHGVADGRWDELPGLYAETTHVSHPFSTEPPLLSREDIRRHFTPPSGFRPIKREPVDIVIHETTDPEVIVAEFAYRSDESVRRCVFVMRVRDGEIVESRDYFGH